MARPAPSAGRQAHGARLLLAALVGACANQGEPPGGPPHTTPPKIVRTVPESAAIVPDFRGDAIIEFDEVIDEMPGSPGPAGTVSGLARQVVLSPVGGDVKVSWHRSAIHVKPAEGWKRDRVYHLELRPGITDLRRNVTKTGTTVVFSTGPAIPNGTLTGTVLLWVEQRPLTQAVIRAAPVPDTVAYVALADSVGGFRLPAIPPGRYLVWGIQDQNFNRHQDRREAFDTVTLTVDSAASAVLWAFVHDTVGPRVRAVEPVDSVTFRISFTQALDPRLPLDTAHVGVFSLPDTAPFPVGALYPPAQFDSIRARARAVGDSLKRVADSLQRARDTTARRDTARAGAAAQRPPAIPQVSGARRDTTLARADTGRIGKLLRQRPVPYDRLVVETTHVLAPGTKYLVRVRGATNLNGAVANAQGVLTVPVPKPAPRDSTKTPKTGTP